MHLNRACLLQRNTHAYLRMIFLIAVSGHTYYKRVSSSPNNGKELRAFSGQDKILQDEPGKILDY